MYGLRCLRAKINEELYARERLDDSAYQKSYEIGVRRISHDGGQKLLGVAQTGMNLPRPK
jgi:hypothetical protein